MNIDGIFGLDKETVRKLQKQYGYNELPVNEKKSIFKIAGSILKEPMILLLITTVVIYFFLGDTGEALLLSLSCLGIVSIQLYQESKTEKSLEALRNLSSPICNVIREGVRVTIPGREVVVGDIMLLSEGSRVPADAKLISSVGFKVDESLLTGESLPVEKSVKEISDYKDNSVFSGTMVVAGHGVAEVTSIGAGTEIGKIGSSLKSIDIEKTLLQREVNHVVKLTAIAAVSISVLLTIIFAIVNNDFQHGLLAGLTLAIAILPEEFPIVLTLFLTLGAWRLAKNNVLARRAHTIETLGSASVLCVDKTGTLTENKMTIVAIIDSNHEYTEKHINKKSEVVKYGVLASQKNPYDPMEEAFIDLGKNMSLESIYDGMSIIKEYPFDSKHLSVVHIWGDISGKVKEIGLKGAPESVIKHCRLDDETKDRIKSDITKLAGQGLRVIAIAKGKLINEEVPANRYDIEYEYLGLVGLVDPIRKEVYSAVESCKTAGIKVVMITGDYAETAANIAEKIGLNVEMVMTGADFEQLSEKERLRAVKHISVFSRVSPANKLTIVNALKKNGEVVAMTGDGVNDAPALKTAHVGVAMGKNGTDVAREAASIVLLDDNFVSIVKGIRLGRRIYDNLQKAMSYIIAVHLPIITLSLLPAFLRWPMILMPAHIVFLEFVIDPSCTVVFENEKESKTIMSRPPRKLSAPIFSRKMILTSVLQGLVVSAVLMIAYWMLIENNWSEDGSRSVIYIALIISNIFLIIGISGRQALLDAVKLNNKSMITVLSITVLALVAVFFIPLLRDLFHFEALNLGQALTGVLIGIVAASGILPAKMLVRKIFK